MFSERAISAVPIIYQDGVVVNLYETVDVIVRHVLLCGYQILSLLQTLVRLGAYQSLDLTISEALNQRSPDFPGVVICTAGDSLGTLLELIKKRRVHRLVVVEGDVRPCSDYTLTIPIIISQEEEKKGGKKGRLLGIITLSDVLRYVIGEVGIGESVEEIAALSAAPSTLLSPDVIS